MAGTQNPRVLTRPAATLVVLAKVIALILDCDLFTSVNVLYSHYLNTIFCGVEFCICFTIMIGCLVGHTTYNVLQLDKFTTSDCNKRALTFLSKTIVF